METQPTTSVYPYEEIRTGLRCKATQYSKALREQDRLPNGVFIMPWDNDDAPVVRTRYRGELLVREGDWVLEFEDGQMQLVYDGVFQRFYRAVD